MTLGTQGTTFKWISLACAVVGVVMMIEVFRGVQILKEGKRLDAEAARIAEETGRAEGEVRNMDDAMREVGGMLGDAAQEVTRDAMMKSLVIGSLALIGAGVFFYKGHSADRRWHNMTDDQKYGPL